MIIDIDLTDGGDAPARFWLVDAADSDHLGVQVLVPDGTPDWIGLARAMEGFARIDRASELVHIRPAPLERLLERAVAGEGRRQGLSAMVARAESEGWIDRTGALAAPVEWEPRVEIEADDFRHVLGHFPTGVAVLSAEHSGNPVGMACNSLTSVSLEPPLVAVCPAKSSETWPEIRDAGRFLINLMPREHEPTVIAFARKGTDRFASVPYHHRRCGPALDDALAWIECSIDAEHEAGDHTIVIARVLALEAREGPEPLVFFRGRYGTFVGADS